MSRPKAVPLQHQQAKLALLAAKFGWATSNDWCAALDIQSVSTITAWKDGGGISDTFKQSIVAYLRKNRVIIEMYELISHTYYEFGLELGLDADAIESIVKLSAINAGISAGLMDEPNIETIDRRIVGEYLGVYLCHASDDILDHAVALERFSIVEDKLRNRLLICQRQNYVTGRPETGPLVCRDDRILAQIEYADPIYPNSVYYLMSILVSGANKIFYGIYTDITGAPVREIFSTKFIMFSWDGDAPLPDRAFAGEDFYRLMLPFVENNLIRRARLVVEPPQYDLRAELLGAVRDGKAALERMTL